MILTYRTGPWAPISISSSIARSFSSSSFCTVPGSTPPSRVQVASTSMERAWADTTVTWAPMGRTDSMYWATWVTISSSNGSFSSLAITTFTVPFPFHSGITAALPTPDTDLAHCL